MEELQYGFYGTVCSWRYLKLLFQMDEGETDKRQGCNDSIF